jgi:hypothetical protein
MYVYVNMYIYILYSVYLLRCSCLGRWTQPGLRDCAFLEGTIPSRPSWRLLRATTAGYEI